MTLGLLDWRRGVARDTGRKVFHLALAPGGRRVATSSAAHEVVTVSVNACVNRT
jgi:hypothetical protein